MPKKLGLARSPHLHYSFNQLVKTAVSQVTSRYIRDCDLDEVEPSTLVFFIFVVLFIVITRRHHTASLWSVTKYHLHYITYKSAVDKASEKQQDLADCKLNELKL